MSTEHDDGYFFAGVRLENREQQKDEQRAMETKKRERERERELLEELSIMIERK